MDAELLKMVVGELIRHSPWALLCFYLVTKLLSSTKREQAMIAAYHTAVVENTRVTERLAILIEERTRVRHQDNG